MFHYWNTGNKWLKGFFFKFLYFITFTLQNHFKPINITMKLLVLIKYAVYHLYHHNMSNDNKIIKP